jgi:hypothetical protein
MALDKDAVEEIVRLDRQISFLDWKIKESGGEGSGGARSFEQTRQIHKERVKQIQNAGYTPSGADQLRLGAQGLTFNLADEAEARVRSFFPSQPSYDEIVGGIRQRNDQVRTDFPRDALALEIGGGSIGGAGLIKQAPRAITATGQFLKNVGQGVLGGSVAGYGASDSDTVIGDAVETVQGGGIGGVIAAFISGVPLAGKKLKEIYDGLSQTAPERADEIIGELMRQTGWTEQRVWDELQSLNASTGGQNATLADLSPSNLGLTSATVSKSDEALQMADDVYGARQQGGQGRIEERIRETTGVEGNLYEEVYRPSPLKVETDQGGTIAQQRGRLYTQQLEEIKNNDIPLTDELMDLLTHKRIEPQLLKVLGDMNMDRDDLDALLSSGSIKLDVINELKKELDALAEEAGSKKQRKLWKDRAREVRTLTDIHVPEYKDMREQFSDLSGVIDSGEQGRRLATTSNEKLEQLARTKEGLNFDESRAFEAGGTASMVEQLKKGAGGTRGTGFAGSKIYSPESGQRQDRLGLLAGDGYDDIMDNLYAESKFHDTFSYLNPKINSKTHSAGAFANKADEAAGAMGAVKSALSGDSLDSAIRVIESFGGMSKNLATEIGTKLMRQDLTRDEIKRMLRRGEIGQDAFEFLSDNLNRDFIMRGALTAPIVERSSGALSGQ